MAIQPVAMIGPEQEEVVVKKGRQGWGKAGSAIGSVVGGVAGAMAGSGWGSVAGATGGAAGGAAFGNMVGEKLRPSQAQETAMERRLGAQAPQMMQSEQTERLKQSILALQSQPLDVQREYSKPLVEAYIASYGMQNQAGRSA